MQLPPIVIAMDYRVKNESSFIRSVNLAAKSQQQLTIDAEKSAIQQQKLEARYESVRYHVDRLRQANLESTQELERQHLAFQKQELEINKLTQRYENWLQKYNSLSRSQQMYTAQGQQALKMTSGLADKITVANRALSTQQGVLSRAASEHRYVNVQLQQRIVREKELEYQLKQAVPAQQKQITFLQSMKNALANTFASWENFSQGVQQFSVTADRLTRSGQRTINIINKISGAITGKPWLDWERGATKATTSTTNFGLSAGKASSGVGDLLAKLGTTISPIRNLSLLSIAAGTALGNLAAQSIQAVIFKLGQLGMAAQQAAMNFARLAIDQVSNYERSAKSLTALVAQELASGGARKQVAAITTFTTEELSKMRLEQEKSSIELRLQEQAFLDAKASGELYGDALRLQEIALEENRARMLEMNQELAKANAANIEAASTQNQVAQATANVRDKLAEAGPKAFELLRWIEKIAIESPFNQEGVKNAFMMLKSFGFMAEDAKRMTSVLIDWSAATGKSTSDMERVALALAQVRNLGRLAGQEVMQLAQAGIAVDQILAKAMNKSVSEIVQMREKGLIPAQEAIDHIIKQLETDWQGAAKDQAKTFSGLISSIQDIVPILARNLFGPMDEATGKIGGVFGAIQPYVSAFVDFLASESTVGKVREFGNKVGAWVTTLLEEGIPRLKEFGTKAMEVFQNISVRGKLFIDKVRGVIDTVMDIFRGGFSGGGGGGKGGGLFKVMEENMPKAVQTFRVAIDSIKIVSGQLAEFWSAKLVPAVQYLASFFKIDLSASSMTVSKALSAVQTAAASFTEFFVIKVMPVLQNVVNYVTSNFPVWKKTIEDAFKTVKEESQPVVDAFVSIYKEVEKNFPQIQQIISSTVETIKRVWADVTETLPGDTQISLSSVVTIISGELEKARAWWDKYGEGVLIALEKAMKFVITFAGVAMIQFRDATKAILLLLEGDWGGALDVVKGMNEKVVKFIKQYWIIELLNLQAFIGLIWSTIQRAIALKMMEIEVNIKNTWLDIYHGTRNRFFELLYAAQDVWNRIKAAIVGVWKDVSYEVKYIYYGLENALKLSWYRLIGEARGIWENFRSMIVEKWEQIRDKVSYYVNMVRDFITNPSKRAEMMAAAVSWIQGIIDGIHSRSGMLSQAASYAAQLALNAIKRVWGIASPSKEGMAIGLNIGTSIASGLMSTLPKIQNSLDALGGGRVSAEMSGRQISGTTNNYNSQSVSNFNLNMATTMPPHSVQQDFRIMESLSSGY